VGIAVGRLTAVMFWIGVLTAFIANWNLLKNRAVMHVVDEPRPPAVA